MSFRAKSAFVGAVGYANFDIFFLGLPRVPREGEEVYAQALEIQPGGGAPATMITLARLNVPVRLATFLGRDEFSERIRGALEEGGVEYENLYDGSGMPVVVSATAVTPGDRTFLSYREQAQVTPAQQDRTVEVLSGAKVVAMQLGMLDVYRELKRRDPSVLLVLDTGWLDDLSMGNYREYLALADYYTPNRAEAMKITGEGTPEKALRKLGRMFEHPIVKLDAEGCLILKDGGMMHVPPRPGVRSVDATGAGDAFLAGVMYGLYHDRDIEDCVIYGNITGGACVEKVGCLAGYVDEPELLRIAAQWQATRLQDERITISNG